MEAKKRTTRLFRRLSDALVILARFPQEGSFRKPLAETIGPGPALELYRSMLSDLIENHRNQPYHLVVALEDAARLDEFAVRFGIPDVFAQRGETPSDRLRNVFEDLLRKHTRVIAIGAEIPNLFPSDMRRAFSLLNERAVVMGPSGDGGVYLLGMKAPLDLFTGIEWGTPKVQEQLLDRALSLSASVSVLQMKADLDRYEDLLRNFARLTDESLPRTRETVRALMRKS